MCACVEWGDFPTPQLGGYYRNLSKGVAYEGDLGASRPISVLDAVRRIIDRETYFPIARSTELIDNHYPIHKYQNALARAKDALIEIRDGRDTASADHMAAMARNALTEISKALLGDKF